MTILAAARRLRFVRTAHPLRALAETWLLGLLILFPLSQVIGDLPPPVFSNGILAVCGACGLWMALRTRLPQTNPLVQVLWELLVGVALSLLMAVGLRLSTHLLGWSEVWHQSNLGQVATLLLLMTGPVYLLVRIVMRLWVLWNQLRRRRLLFSLTHAHLTLVVLVLATLIVFTALVMVTSGNWSSGEPASGTLTAESTDRLFRTVIPAIGIWSALAVIVVIAMLPPSAAVSYLIARRTTRRLERLAGTAQAMRHGDYGARVEVTGEDEVAQLQSDFNAMAEELERTLQDLEAQRDTVSCLMESRRDLVASVSHELRTPVATLRAVLESALQRKDDPSPALQHELEVMEGEVLRLQRLIDDLFTLSRLEVGQLAMTCRPIDITPVVRRIVDAMAVLAWDSGRVTVVNELPDELPAVCVDETRLGQVLANLLHNGISHTPPGGIVAVTVSTDDGDDSPPVLSIEVHDTGEGISPEDLPHIWERFYRGASVCNGSRGAGLGLALAKDLVEAMGGTIAVQSAVGEGSCFAVRLPQARPDVRVVPALD